MLVLRLLSVFLITALLGGRLGEDWLHTKHTEHTHGPASPQEDDRIMTHEDHCAMCDMAHAAPALPRPFLELDVFFVASSLRDIPALSYSEAPGISLPGRSPPASVPAD
jgi:hypothetical protein